MLGWVPKTEDLLPIGDEVTSGIGQMCALPSLPFPGFASAEA